MGLMSSIGGNDDLQMRMFVWGFVLSLAISIILPVLYPAAPSTGYTIEEIYAEREGLEAYTGESMMNQAPFVLAHVYTPYVAGDEYRTTADGWLYGDELTNGDGDPYYVPSTASSNQIGLTKGIHLEPSAKSDVPLFQSDYKAAIHTKSLKWYYTAADGQLNTLGGIAQFFGADVYETSTQTLPAWNFSGYRYEFDPMLRINTTDGSDLKAVSDATLSIVWYDLDGSEGISGGLVLYNNITNGIVANYTATEIVSNYQTSSSTATGYALDFDGTRVHMYIQFDPDVKVNGTDLETAWTEGRWTVAFTCTSADAFLDITNSNSFSGAVGNIIDTYGKLMTLNLPNISPEFNLILWIICIGPMAMAVLLFLSRFGIAGVGAGILGMVITGVSFI